MSTSLLTSILSIGDKQYSAQTAGKAWSLVQLDSDTFRFEVRKGDSWSIDPATKNRSELTMRSTIKDGTVINVNYKMTVEPGAKNTSDFTVLGQFHQNQGNSDSGKAPPFSIGLVGERMVVTIAYRDATGKDMVETIFTDAKNVSRGHDYSFSIRVEFDPDGIGHLVVKRDGVKIADYAGPLGWPNQTSVYWKEGIYRGAASETLAVTYSGLSVGTAGLAPSTSPGSESDGPITYYQYGGDGKVVAKITTQEDGARSVQSFDAGGKLVKLTETATSGAWSVTTYGITGKSFQTETISYDASGKVVSMVGRHTDGSLDYQQIRGRDGSLDNWTYNSAGSPVKHEIVKAGGGREVFEYGPASKTVPATHRVYDASGKLTTVETYYGNGKLDTKQNFYSSGSKILSDYDSKGALVAKTVYLADGSRQVDEYGITGKSFASTQTFYDKSGALLSQTRFHEDGSRDYRIEKKADGTLASFYSASGALTKIQATGNDGSKDVYEYGYANKSFASLHREYDKAGRLVTYEQKNADGSLDVLKLWKADGSMSIMDYDSRGKLISTTFVQADQSKDVGQYNITGKSYTSTQASYDKNGQLESLVRYHADNSRDFAVEKTSEGTITSFYNAAGALMKKEVKGFDGGRDVFEYNIAGKSYISTERVYDEAGKLVFWSSLERDGDKSMTAFAKGVTMEGGSGDDYFSAFGGDKLVFKNSFGHDTVRNFHAGTGAGHDTIVIDAGSMDSYSDLGMKQVGSDVVVTVGGHGTITLDHVNLGSLHAADFLFI